MSKVYFSDVESDFCEETVLCRLLHFWEARNHTRGNVLIGVELYLIDEKGTTIQAFISANRIHLFENSLKTNSVYKLKRFVVGLSRRRFKITDNKFSVTFTNQTVFEEVTKELPNIDVQKFRTRVYETFFRIADKKEDLYDVVGKIMRITGDDLAVSDCNSEKSNVTDVGTKDRVFLHLLMEDGETIRIFLWENAAATFRACWNKRKPKLTVVLITAVVSKTVAGAITLTSTAATRFFFDNDVPETKKFIVWLGEKNDKAPQITSASSGITKLETVMINELHQFVENQTPQTCSFHCIATIVDVDRDRGWKYVSCTGCTTKLELCGSSLECRTCKKVNKVGVLRFRYEVTVEDEKKDVATFVMFDSDTVDLIGKRAPEVFALEFPELDADYGSDVDTQSIPSCLLGVIGLTCKFEVKITPYNFTAYRQSFSVTRIVEHDILPELKTGLKEKQIEEKTYTHDLHDVHGSEGNKVGQARKHSAKESLQYASKRKDKQSRRSD